jgi:hypothetical protein
MATPTFIPLAEITLLASDSSITFSSIPNTFRDIVIVMAVKRIGASGGPFIRFNNDSGNNYSMAQLANDGGNTLGNIGTTTYGWLQPNSNLSTSNFDSIRINIFDYSTTDKTTTYLSRCDNAETGVYHNALSGRWANSSVIDTITVGITSNDFAAGSTIGLFGIEA